MKPFITIKSTKQMLCDGNLEVAQVKSFSGRTDLYKVLTIEAFIMMLLSKTCLNHKVFDTFSILIMHPKIHVYLVSEVQEASKLINNNCFMIAIQNYIL